MWGSEPSFQWVDFCGVSVLQFVSHPPNSYGIWFYCDCAPLTVSLWLLLCLGMWGIFFHEFQCLPFNDCSAVICDSGALAKAMIACLSTLPFWTILRGLLLNVTVDTPGRLLGIKCFFQAEKSLDKCSIELCWRLHGKEWIICIIYYVKQTPEDICQILIHSTLLPSTSLPFQLLSPWHMASLLLRCKPQQELLSHHTHHRLTQLLPFPYELCLFLVTSVPLRSHVMLGTTSGRGAQLIPDKTALFKGKWDWCANYIPFSPLANYLEMK